MASMVPRQPIMGISAPANGLTKKANRPLPATTIPSAMPRRATKARLITRVKVMKVAPAPVTAMAKQLK